MGAKDPVSIALEEVTILGGTMYKGDFDAFELTSGELYFVTNDPGTDSFSLEWSVYAVDPVTDQEAGTPVYSGTVVAGTAPAQVNYEGNLASRSELASLPGVKYRLYTSDLGTVTVGVTLAGQA